MAALGDIQESPSVPSPVSLSSPGTPGTQHHEPQLHLHGHQHGSPGSSPKVLSQPSDLDLQDVEEVEIGRDTFWPVQLLMLPEAVTAAHSHLRQWPHVDSCRPQLDTVNQELLSPLHLPWAGASGSGHHCPPRSTSYPVSPPPPASPRWPPLSLAGAVSRSPAPLP
uniref:GLI family zinc finger 4 n=1 Tax=Gorilla gorilla gorilla TaxID=9595 RepID=A0A2I2YEH4_GORGO